MAFLTKNWALSGMSSGEGILVSGESGTSVIVVGITVANFDPTNNATVSLGMYDKYAQFKSYIVPSGDIDYTSALYLNEKFFLNEGDYIFVESNKANVSILANGIELT